jgi:hypothetical protein
VVSKLKFWLRKELIIVFLSGFLLIWLVSKRSSLHPWTEQEIEDRCGLTSFHGLSNGIDNRLQLGWDSSHHYYVAE